MAYSIAHSRGERLDAEVITIPDGLKQGNAGGRHPQARPAQLLGRGRRMGRGHGVNLSR